MRAKKIDKDKISNKTEIQFITILSEHLLKKFLQSYAGRTKMGLQNKK